MTTSQRLVTVQALRRLSMRGRPGAGRPGDAVRQQPLGRQDVGPGVGAATIVEAIGLYYASDVI